MTNATGRAVDAAVDDVLRELNSTRRLQITSNPASNLRDGFVAGLMDRGFDIVPIEGFTPPSWVTTYQVEIRVTTVAATEIDAIRLADDHMRTRVQPSLERLEDEHNVEITDYESVGPPEREERE